MSHPIAGLIPARRPNAAFAAVRALMLSLLMLVSHGVWADPVAADRVLEVTKQNFDMLKQNYKVAKIQLQTGQPNAAVLSFTMAKAQSMQMTSNLTRLLNENQHTLQNGLYNNGAAQQQAVEYNSIAKSTSQMLQTKLTILSLQPTSQIDLILADQQLSKLTSDMLRLEQAMVAAQQ